MRPLSWITRICWSRCVGAVSATGLGTAVTRGGMITATGGSGWRAATAGNRFAIIGAVCRDRGNRASDLIEQGANLGGIAFFGGRQRGGKNLTAFRIDREV